MTKPTTQECLDALAVIWAHVAEQNGVAEAIGILNRKEPGWRTAKLERQHQNPEDLQAIQSLKAWAHAEVILKRAGRI